MTSPLWVDRLNKTIWCSSCLVLVSTFQVRHRTERPQQKVPQSAIWGAFTGGTTRGRPVLLGHNIRKNLPIIPPPSKGYPRHAISLDFYAYNPSSRATLPIVEGGTGPLERFLRRLGKREGGGGRRIKFFLFFGVALFFLSKHTRVEHSDHQGSQGTPWASDRGAKHQLACACVQHQSGPRISCAWVSVQLGSSQQRPSIREKGTTTRTAHHARILCFVDVSSPFCANSGSAPACIGARTTQKRQRRAFTAGAAVDDANPSRPHS